MKLIIGLLMLCIIVIAHELGHMLLAKANHIDVKEFWVGFGPKLFAFERGGTRYVLRLIPFGGACVFDIGDLDEEDEAEADGKAGTEPVENADQIKSETVDEITEVNTDTVETIEATDDTEIKADIVENTDEDTKSSEEKKVKYDKKGRRLLPFNEASVWARIATLFAGPLFNFILAFIMGLVVVTFTYNPDTTLTGVTEGSPAEAAGLMEGDKIVKLNGSNVYLYREVSMGIQTGIGKPLRLVYERDGKKYKAELIPELDEEYGSYMIGVSFGGENEYTISAWNSIKNSILYERFMIKMTFMSLKMLFNGQANIGDVSGPVGVASIVSSEYDAAAKISPLAIIVSMLNIAVLISANLGVMNLLPFPALDGGRLIFCIYEVITGRKPDEKVEGFVHFIGSLLLILLTLFVFFNDIIKMLGFK